MHITLKSIGIFLITLFTLLILLVTSALIDPSYMFSNLKKSSEILSSDPIFYEGTVYASAIDKTADGVLFNMIWNTDSSHPFISTLKASCYMGDDRGGHKALSETLQGKEPDSLYMRYWHGTEIFVRPLLLITDLNGIRVVQLFMLIISFVILFLILYKKKYYSAIIFTGISFLITRCFYCVISIEFFSVPFIAFLISCCVLICNKKENMPYLFLLSGILTSFFDFLTAETLTFTIPMLFMLYSYSRKERAEILFFENKENAVFTSLSIHCFICGLLWFIGYLVTFLSRWFITAALGISTLDNVWETLTYRITGETPDFNGNSYEFITGKSQVMTAISTNIATLFGSESSNLDSNSYLYIALIITIIAFIIIYLFRRSDDCHVKTWHYIVIFFIPIARIMIVSEHSLQHSFFTYRALWASVLSLLFIFSEQMMWSTFKRKKTK